MGDDSGEDIQRVLAVCFRTNTPLFHDDLVRILTLDMNWMDDKTASKAIESLLNSGWLSETNDGLIPVCSLRGVTAPLGWQPRPSRLLSPTPPKLSYEFEEPKTLKLEKQPEIELVFNDPRSKLERRLARYIAEKSGLEVTEVKRRSKRKRIALRYCTMWMALSLVAREQNLEMENIIHNLSIVNIT